MKETEANNKKWNWVYLLIVVVLIIQILIYYNLTIHFA